MICSIENRHVGLDERKRQFPASGGIFSCIVLCTYIIPHSQNNCFYVQNTKIIR